MLHIIPNLKKGGAERLVLDLCIALNSLSNIELILVTFQEGNDYPFLTGQIHHRFIPSKFVPSILKKPEINFNDLQVFIDDFSPHIIHSHLFESEILLSQIDCGKAKRIVHFHNKILQFRKIEIRSIFQKSTWTNWVEKQAVLGSYRKNQTELIAISKDTLDYIHANMSGFVNQLLPNAVNLQRFSSNSHSYTSNRLVTIGRLDTNKNQGLAIDVIKRLHENGHMFHLDILGYGPEIEHLKEKRNQLHLKDFVHFQGNVDQPELFLENSFAYIHTARSEAFGLTMIEAMAAGLPVVCTNGGGNAELVENGINGYCLEELNAAKLAERIAFLKENKNIYNNLKLAAVSYSKQFDISNYANKVFDVYKKI